jgi:hypothetical protein
MQIELTKEQRNKFISIIMRDSLLFPGEINTIRFYETFMDFIEDNEIEMEEESIDKAEKELFNHCINRGYIGSGKIATFLGEDKEKFFNSIKKTAPRVFFQIVRYNEEDAKLTVSDIAEKYEGTIPGGWIATYCTCGTFFPATKDINSDLNERISGEEFEPVDISLKDIDTIDIMSDNVLHFNMVDGKTYECAILMAARSGMMLETLKK